jgi:hypothetical protein
MRCVKGAFTDVWLSPHALTPIQRSLSFHVVQRQKGMDVRLGFLTGDSGPLAFYRRLKLFELCIGHTPIPRPDVLVQGIMVSCRWPSPSGV